MNRREFSIETARALLGGAAIAISGCGGSSPTASTLPLTDAEGTVSDNHGHSASIRVAQLTAGGALELQIQGTSSHQHTVSLSTSEVQTVRNGGRVEKESSGSRHTHIVTFN